MTDFEDYLPEKKCCICKRLFVPAPQHIYKKGSTEWCCTYTCYMELCRRHEWQLLAIWARRFEKRWVLADLSLERLELILSHQKGRDREDFEKYLTYRRALAERERAKIEKKGAR